MRLLRTLCEGMSPGVYYQTGKGKAEGGLNGFEKAEQALTKLSPNGFTPSGDNCFSEQALNSHGKPAQR